MINGETVPRSRSEVKCNAATPGDNSDSGASAVLFTAADAL